MHHAKRRAFVHGMSNSTLEDRSSNLYYFTACRSFFPHPSACTACAFCRFPRKNRSKFEI